MGDGLTTLFLCGDVMTGRGVDQILPHPGNPQLWETLMSDARGYVGLAEAANGSIPRPVDDSWPWGDSLAELEAEAPDVRVLNLETSVTGSDDAADDKAVLYRMAPANIGCLRVARPDVCVLANNHVLDFGRAGLAETIETVTAAGIAVAGAGADATEASRPALIATPGGRVVVVSCGTPSSGIPHDWAARDDRAGVHLVPELTSAAADAITESLRQDRRPGDVAVVSVHWGSNWGYDVPPSHVDFAHRLIDGGVHIVHGHSSHHPRPIEIYRDRLILYGCGDFIDDYEGIGGYEAYRDDLRLMYFAAVEPGTGRLAHLRMVPMQARQMRLRLAAPEDAEYLADLLDRISPTIGGRVRVAADRSLSLRPS